MSYPHVAITDAEVPLAAVPLLQHLIATYASETNKIASVWHEFRDEDLEYRPHPRSTSVGDLLRHQLLSERRFFGEFLGVPEPPADAVLPARLTVPSAIERLVTLARPRLDFFAAQPAEWWMTRVKFFDVERDRAWIFWRRVLHTAHHRTQLTVYLRLMGRAVPATYGPTADVTWTGADPTQTAAAAGRK
jgi:uncharacterized damage-inducible protein DinB